MEDIINLQKMVQFIEDGIQMEQILTIMRQMEAVQKILESR